MSSSRGGRCLAEKLLAAYRSSATGSISTSSGRSVVSVGSFRKQSAVAAAQQLSSGFEAVQQPSTQHGVQTQGQPVETPGGSLGQRSKSSLRSGLNKLRRTTDQQRGDGCSRYGHSTNTNYTQSPQSNSSSNSGNSLRSHASTQFNFTGLPNSSDQAARPRDADAVHASRPQPAINWPTGTPHPLGGSPVAHPFTQAAPITPSSEGRAAPPAVPTTSTGGPGRPPSTPELSKDSDSLTDDEVRQAYPNVLPPDVHVVDTAAEAQSIAARLASFSAEQLGSMVFGCDTEVMDIDISSHSPCCHGRVICLSIYCGPEHHFGAEQDPAVKRSMLWVDTYLDGEEARQGEAAAIMDAFRPFFASTAHRKVWHNYSFDRHVMERAGFEMRGFGGDTMHMARLWDSSRMMKGGYSLEALSGNPEVMQGGQEETVQAAGEGLRGKISMKRIFGKNNLKKDGTEGKLKTLPLVEELQSCADTKWKWVNYSAFDAKSTWDLYSALEAKLRAMDVAKHVDRAVADDLANPAGLAGQPVRLRSMWDVYQRFYLPFGELLTDMEAAGMAVDRPHLAEAELQAQADQQEAEARFRTWATAAVPEAQFMNVGSGPQVSQLLFAGCVNKNPDKPGVPLERVFKVPNATGYIAEGAKKAKKTRDITLYSVWGDGVRSPLVPEIYTPGGAPACNTAVIKMLAGKAGKARKALAELEAKPDTGFERDDAFLARSEAGGDAAVFDVEAILDEDGAEWSTDSATITETQKALQQAAMPQDPAVLLEEAAEKGYGKLYSHFRTAEAGLRACAAVDALVDVSAIDTLLSNFIIPLQSDSISKPDARGVHRVHCSLNINTETGRLSARRPNLQNQPALEKDRYKVRKAFTADVSAGKTLVVADYGQLELRILAHMANCKSMIEAFELGGDFHSRTALGMYDHIKEAIAAGKCLLEWKGGDTGDEPPPAPLLKDMFASERRKAKVLNFSIAYGKTAHGLSKDWGVSLTEAQDTVKRWYADRPEVDKWQAARRKQAEEEGYVCTLLGRRRLLPDARHDKNKALKAHALRAAINTPIQGSAADVAMAAMIRIQNDPQLADLGYKLLLQVHDEVILEGPREHAEAARQRVIECMRSPFNASTPKPLLVDLAVDCKYADTWYEAK